MGKPEFFEEDIVNDNFRRCRGAVRATRSSLALFPGSDANNPLLPKLSPDLNSSGLKKRLAKASSGSHIMGSEVQNGEPRLPDVVVKVGAAGCQPSSPTIRETHYTVGSQIVIPFFIAGMGMVLAGIYLDIVQTWKVFKEVPEIIVLVPALLGLKGNLEMTLASRLSTEANLGNMDDGKEQWSMIVGNLTLVQCQAIVVGLLSSVMAVVMVAGMRQEFDIDHTLFLCACSILTASVASFVLGLITAAVIVVSRRYKINPDNVATPIAGSLGDITSLILLSLVATYLYDVLENSVVYSVTIICGYIMVMPLWFWIAKNNKYTNVVLYTGWAPVIIAMLISTFGGLILDTMVNLYNGVAVFQPVINGVGGNLVSIQASRLSTALHKEAELGTLPPTSHICVSPWNMFFSKATYAVTARVLVFLMFPGHIIFAYFIYYVNPESSPFSLYFLFVYLTAAFLQVTTLLFLAYILTHWFWSQGINPDNSTIPYLTAIGDLLGIILLGLAFQFLYLIDKVDRH